MNNLATLIIWFFIFNIYLYFLKKRIYNIKFLITAKINNSFKEIKAIIN